MKDLTSPTWIKCKGVLFLFVGIAAGALLLVENWSWKNALLLSICVWSFCRAYYFAFYVIEKYVDSKFKFSGLGAFCGYLFQNRKPNGIEPQRHGDTEKK